jgi:hypothetical protein
MQLQISLVTLKKSHNLVTKDMTWNVIKMKLHQIEIDKKKNLTNIQPMWHNHLEPKFVITYAYVTKPFATKMWGCLSFLTIKMLTSNNLQVE